MSKPTPTFYVPMNFDNPYPGPLKLGQLISDIKDPRYAIDTSGPLSLEDNKIEEHSNNQAVVVHNQSQEVDVATGLFFSALQFVGLRAGVNFDKRAFSIISSSIESLDYKGIVPTDEYVLKSMEQENVQKWLKHHWLRSKFKNVYMITGLKIARPKSQGQTRITHGTEQSSTGTAGAEVSGDAAGLPVGGGAQVSGATLTSHSYSFVPTKPFVYGFELRACHYGVKRASSKPMIKGALLSTEREPKTDPSPEPDRSHDLGFVFHGVADEDLNASELGVGAADFESRSKIDETDGDQCHAVFIR